MNAIIFTGGKQLRVKKDQEILVEKIAGDVDAVVEFNQVLMIDDKIGQPFLPGAKVIGTVVNQGKARKIIVFKYRAKKNSKSKYGHRQPFTRVKITDILLGDNVNGSDSDSKTKK